MNYLLDYPKTIAILLLIVIGFFVYQIPNFELDASADSLVLENDKDLLYYQKIHREYASNDTLVIAYTPKKGKLIDKKQLQNLDIFQQQLKQLANIKSVFTILDAPLFRSPPINIANIVNSNVSLRSKDIDLELAKKEFLSNPFYSNNLISEDGETTAILITLDTKLETINNRDKRNQLRLLKQQNKLSKQQAEKLEYLEVRVKQDTSENSKIQKQIVKNIRFMSEFFTKNAVIFLGGLPIITTDIISYIENDLVVFSIAVIVIMMLMLTILFDRLRWTILPIAVSITAAVTMTGILAFLNWKVTVISSNFLSLLLVMTLSVMVHLIVRYRELISKNTEFDNKIIIKKTLKTMFKPCLYTTLTTAVAFVSLLVSGIRPVIDFGYIMSVGVVLALIMSFLFFALAVSLIPKPKTSKNKESFSITGHLARWTDKYNKYIIILAIFIFIISIFGITKLSVENRFIDYFKSDTEISKGLSLIDTKLGGTTPLEIIIDDLGYDYWYDKDVREQVHEIQEYLESLPSTGKVLSIDVPLQLITIINNNKKLSGFFLNIVRAKIPEFAKKYVINPYISENIGQLRFVVRVKDTDRSLNRNELITTIREHLTNNMNLQKDTVHITGTLVLYNNMLQSLFSSQIETMGLVFAMIFIMFLAVFRSFVFSVLAIITNILPSFLVLGIMGILGIPLDLMTITIASIAIGIGVDNAIHYIHRFKKEFIQDMDYKATMYRSHNSIGVAMFYTSITVTIGFLVLVFSNFIPSIYFGIFTAIAMTTALFANLTLLPILILLFKPKIVIKN